jgi:hypothetical protein
VKVKMIKGTLNLMARDRNQKETQKMENMNRNEPKVY